MRHPEPTGLLTTESIAKKHTNATTTSAIAKNRAGAIAEASG
jgi:hypothetical protein